MDSIRTYDIRYSVSLVRLVEFIHDPKPIRRKLGDRVIEYPGRVIDYRPLKPGEVEPVKQDYRLVYSHSRRRAEFTGSTGQPSVRIFDGTVEKHREGRFGDILAKSMGLIPRDYDYESFLRLAMDGVSYRLLGKDRPPPDVKRVDDDGAVRVLLHYGTNEKTVGYRSMTFDVYLDPERGMLPAKIEIKRDKVLFCRRVVNRFHKLPDGGWAPVEMTTSYFLTNPKMALYGKPLQKYVLTVDVDASSWNEPVKDEEFVLAFPEGTAVIDEVRKLHLIAGKGDTGKNIDDLVKNARVATAMKNEQSAPAPPAATSNRSYWIIAVNVLIVILLAAGLIWYKRRASAA